MGMGGLVRFHRGSDIAGSKLTSVSGYFNRLRKKIPT